MTSRLEDLRFIRSADVYKAGLPAASLIRLADGSTEFRYLEGYVAEHAADPTRAVATSLPIGSSPVVTPSGALPAFFAGLLPEGHRLSTVIRAVKTSSSDELSLLLAVGADTPGDVQVVAAGEALNEPAGAADTPSGGELDFTALAERIDEHAIPGVQDKASASMISTPVATRHGRFILKLSPDAFPRLVENEAEHLRALRIMRLPIARAEVLHDSQGRSGLLVHRFDRTRAGSAWERLAFEDATQVLGLPPASKYGLDSESAIAALASVAAAPLVAVRNLYAQFVLAWLTGNGDLHGKNIGVLRDAESRWRIAPIYDVPCTAVYRDFTLALPVAGRVRGLRSRHWAEFADTIGLPDKAAQAVNLRALDVAAGVDLAAAGFTGSPLAGAERELRARRRELAEKG